MEMDLTIRLATIHHRAEGEEVLQMVEKELKKVAFFRVRYGNRLKTFVERKEDNRLAVINLQEQVEQFKRAIQLWPSGDAGFAALNVKLKSMELKLLRLTKASARYSLKAQITKEIQCALLEQRHQYLTALAAALHQKLAELAGVTEA